VAFEIVCMAANLVVELGVFDGNRCLVCEDLQPLRVSLGEEARGATVHVQEADDLSMANKWAQPRRISPIPKWAL